jgi:uroporphyrin-III C-methyltransferase/precorrin-2 dehydrogenase/sirohydrochlorin ferrochelatase
MSDFLPIFFNISGRPCLVVGAGDVAARKVRQLQRYHAEVHVQAPEISEELKLAADQGHIYYHAGRYDPESLAAYVLVIAATNDEAVNAQISAQAQSLRIPVNVVDQPQLCSFIMPSIVDRDPVQIAISTGGASPVLARLLRSRLETLIPSSFGNLAALMQEYRDRVKEKFPDMQTRRRFWEGVIQGPIAEMFFSGQDNTAREALADAIDGAELTPPKGEVYLVGGGPGDPDLLTFRALRLLQQAEVILFDRLVNPAIIDLARKDAERIYVGKESDRHAVPQEQINTLLVKLAQEGKRVLRLKGGDPFIFGRGGEEIESLAEAGVSFQVVPGITAASACSSYAGIPLTHRDYAQTCIFITGHMKDGKLDLNWDTLVQPGQTIAIYMGVKAIELLCHQLIEHGMDADMPAAIIQQGSLPQQQVYTGTVKTLASIASSKDITPPSMIIIGQVVKLRDKLAWY